MVLFAFINLFLNNVCTLFHENKCFKKSNYWLIWKDSREEHQLSRVQLRAINKILGSMKACFMNNIRGTLKTSMPLLARVARSINKWFKMKSCILISRKNMISKSDQWLSVSWFSHENDANPYQQISSFPELLIAVIKHPEDWYSWFE